MNFLLIERENDKIFPDRKIYLKKLTFSWFFAKEDRRDFSENPFEKGERQTFSLPKRKSYKKK